MKLLSQINDPADMRKLPQSKLQPLADEIREYMIEVLSKIGGHTGASLGPVELILGMHYVFNTPQDKLVFDIGHQAYAHKIITGRRDSFPTIRQYDGISGFLKRDESPYDVFNAAHAGTSISAALGIAAARDLKNEDFDVVAFIGDAGLTAGMALEGINQVGHLKKRMIILLNDNEMSISPNVGALAGYLNRIRTARPYNEFKHEVEEWLKSIPAVGEMMLSRAKAVKDTLARAFIPGALWEELGLKYMGPINGHDINTIIQTFEDAKKEEGPVLIHALTVKGKGYEPAERDKCAWHGTSAFEISTGKFIKEPATAPSYTAVFAQATIDLMKEDDRIVAITAAMPDGTGLNKVMAAFPERTYDVAIAEQHAVTYAAGMATEGLKPIVAIYSTFLQRAYDQIFHDVVLMDLDVTFALDRGGVAGADGPTHHGLMDFAYLRPMSGFVIMAPKDENELRHMMKTAVDFNGPASVRYPRGNGLGVPMDDEIHALEIGKAEILREGSDVAILGIGSEVHYCLKASERLASDGIAATVVNARFVKPLDEELILALARSHGAIVTVEDHYLMGGFGSAVIELLEHHRMSDVRVLRLGFPDKLIEHGPQNLLLAKYGLDADGIYSRVKEFAASRFSFTPVYSK
ncbi:MAG TPA: 1-deoxy-D-xylulose-5-phosphate synthase [Blastocatellia bacterium]|jgi:1-deoxy-D-xylulose-5-phosphate synthase|nr:1-deoxy-D-xylulose-5-phosphate synthase [Blastocatellia bacterium]